jgi:L-cysteine S-thiosulfotransferase
LNASNRFGAPQDAQRPCVSYSPHDARRPCVSYSPEDARRVCVAFAPAAVAFACALGLLIGGCANGVASSHDAGRTLAHDWRKGNCLACHKIPNDAQASTSADIGPPLRDVKARFPKRADLRDQLWDARGRNPETVMPPFGTAGILTEAEIDKIMDYLYAY